MIDVERLRQAMTGTGPDDRDARIQRVHRFVTIYAPDETTAGEVWGDIEQLAADTGTEALRVKAIELARSDPVTVRAGTVVTTAREYLTFITGPPARGGGS